MTGLSRERLIRHLAWPAVAPAAIVCLYFTPKDAVGCANRGLAAVAIVLCALVGGFFAVAKSIRATRAGDREDAGWWVATAIVLGLPAVLVLGPLG
jgi:hypothetical protein